MREVTYQGNRIASGNSDYIRTRDDTAALLMHPLAQVVDDLKCLLPQAQIGRRFLFAWSACRSIKQH
ncbi:conserved hypothetical protein [Ricinus communis]|uniref:Uncharacterized protein n=1 Tax=Ricinus communis TaxID=3988 RepID=B9SE96_RICCO|nr:conserved hypothetical protein [Ricinus communis]